MKKQLPFCLLSFIFFGFTFVHAQITVTRNDFADVGVYTVNAHDTVFSGIVPGSAGASQTWDFGLMQNHYIDSNYFMAPAATPYASDFPSSNVAVFNTLDSSYIFINANTGAANIVGYVLPNPYTGSPTALSFSPVVTQITFPSTMSTTFNVTNASAQSTFYYSGTYQIFTFDSIRTTTTVNRTSLIDGWGTVMTPAGTYSALRQNLTEITDIALEAYITTPPLGWQPVPLGQTDTTIHYYYIANGHNWPVAEIQTNYSGAVTSAQYLAGSGTFNAVPEIKASGNNDLLIYPNPSAGEFNISVLNNKAALLKIFDVNGNETGKISLDNSLKNFSLPSCSAGIYMFQVLDRTGTLISTGKLSIRK